MQQLTADGQAVVSDLASRHGFSTDAVTHMLFAVLGGNGGMAQFSHPEFGGSGQWMRGGMLMIGDMFNGHLKGRVDSLCWDISNLLANQPGLLRQGSFQSQSQGGGGHQHQGSGAPAGGSSLFVPDPEDNWWPPELGTPNATGAQNNARYAYFSGSRRLAVKTGADVWVYDTQDHQIGGFSQQQGVGGSMTFGSQYGTVSLATLPVVSRNGQPVVGAAPVAAVAPGGEAQAVVGSGTPTVAAVAAVAEDIIANIERLAVLKEKGILTDEEFSAKKTELLARL
ncbi:MAG: SHOCT domain-containing protein [Myxococcales bacterium]|nr:SHOCT domain-containing protein [Myxococcales bacterium]